MRAPVPPTTAQARVSIKSCLGNAMSKVGWNRFFYFPARSGHGVINIAYLVSVPCFCDQLSRTLVRLFGCDSAQMLAPRSHRPWRFSAPGTSGLLVLLSARKALVAADIIGLVDDQGSTPHGSPDRQNCHHLGLYDLEEGCTHSLFFLLKVAVLASIILGLGFATTRRGSGMRKILRIFSASLFIMTSLTAVLMLLLGGTMPAWVVGEYELPTSTAILGSVGTAASQTPIFTVPASADVGRNIIPNIKDPEAVDPQKVCPGYKVSNVQETSRGFTADLSLTGPSCNVYGNDIEELSLLVTFQEDDRLRIQIQPRYIGPENQTWFLLPEELVPRPPDGEGTGASSSHFSLSWSNEPSFSFTVKRSDTGDTLFTTKGKVLVYQDQFLEFGSSLPENYNLYGLGEAVHEFRLGNNLTSML